MNLLLWFAIVLCLCPGTRGMVDQTTKSRWHSYQTEKGQRIIQHFKRHSDGTFTSDYTNYLDRMKAKNFVEWLAHAKEYGFCKDLIQIPAEV